MVRLGASRAGVLSVRLSEKSRWAPMQCVLNDVFLLAYEKLTDPAPKVRLLLCTLGLLLMAFNTSFDGSSCLCILCAHMHTYIIRHAAPLDDACSW